MERCRHFFVVFQVSGSMLTDCVSNLHGNFGVFVLTIFGV